MRMYELWKQADPEAPPARLEDEGGPVLFRRPRDAEAYSRREPDYGEATYLVVPVTVGLA